MLENIPKWLEERKTLPPCTWLVGIYRTFQGASALPLHDHSGWTARGRRRDRDRCARSDSVCVCAAHQLGTVTPTHEESLGEGETLHPKCHAPSWSRNISIHPRSRITANWIPIQVTKRNLVPPRCFWGCGRCVAVLRRGGIAFQAWGNALVCR